MELRELQVFEAVATDLHFGRAAGRLFMGQPAVSEQIRKLERELGTPLFHRTSRRVELTPAGLELLGRARSILAQVGDAATAVGRFRDGRSGSFRLGVTPPVAPVLAPHLIGRFGDSSPGVEVDLRQMWLPDLRSALLGGMIDVGITPGIEELPPGIEHRTLGGEPLLAGLRPDHRLAGRPRVAPEELADEVLGQSSASLFPAWVAAQRQVLRSAGVRPPIAALRAADLNAVRWHEQPEIDWILSTPSLSGAHRDTVFVPLDPMPLMAFSLLWSRQRGDEPVSQRFRELCLRAALPPGWVRPD